MGEPEKREADQPDWVDEAEWGQGVAKAIPIVKASVSEYRCELRLRDYLRRAVPEQRNAEVDKCKMPDAAKGYCFVSALGDDGVRRTEGVPVAIGAPDGIDVTRFLDDASAKATAGRVVPLMTVEGAVLTYIERHP